MRLALMLLLAVGLAAQQKPPVRTKRVAAPKAEAAKPQEPAEKVPDLVTGIAVPHVDLMDPTASEAVRISSEWMLKTVTPEIAQNGTVQYVYGQGYPQLVCSPLRVCTVEFQPGEKIAGEPQFGDSRHWIITPANFAGTDAIVVKPRDAGWNTNLVVTTDRRLYNIGLVSRQNEFVTGISFRYPEDEKKKWAEMQAKLDAEKVPVQPAAISVERLNFAYVVKGGNKHTKPTRVYDDGAKTYVQMPEDIQHWELPALLVFGDDGQGTMSNLRVRDNTYIVDRLFDKAKLMVGTKKKQHVEILREGKG
jgi:type IV secretion system protein TrbG